VIALSFVVFIVNVLYSRRRGEEAGADPWDGRTLEWSTPSPPPEFNFTDIPIVEHRDDFWHRKYTETPEGVPAPVIAGGANGHGDESHGHGIHMPDPSYFPAVAALGIPLMGYGVIYNWALIPIGGLIALLGLFGWVLEPQAEEHI
jgi:cytochrome c oxidase subunit 1